MGGGGEEGKGGSEHFPGFRFPFDGSAFYTVKKTNVISMITIK
jgi:hypothetical protein